MKGIEVTNSAADATPLVYSRVAGLAYLVIIVVAILNVSLIDANLIVPGDDAATANNIMANDLLFRLGIVGVLVVYASVVVLSLALYSLLKTVNQNLALLALLLRSGEAVLGAATVLLSFTALLLLNRTGTSAAFEAEQLQALAGLLLDVRTAGLDVVLIFVGLGGTVFCYLFFASKCVPRVLAVWGMFTYSSMLVLALVSILLPNHSATLEVVLYALGALFELIFGLWLLIKGVTNTPEMANKAPAAPENA